MCKIQAIIFEEFSAENDLLLNGLDSLLVLIPVNIENQNLAVTVSLVYEKVSTNKNRQ